MMIRTIAIGLGLAAAISAAAQTTNTFPASGNVGIGTTAPGNLLEVNGTAQVDGILQVGNGTAPANLLLQDVSGANWSLGTANDVLNFTDSTGAKVLSLCDSGSACNGQVGIGTTSPSAELDVRLTTNSSGSGPIEGLNVFNTITTGSSSDNPQNHLQTQYTGSGTQAVLFGLSSVAIQSGGGILNNAYGGLFKFENTGSVTMINGFAAYAQSPSGGGPITNAYAFYANDQNVSGVTHAYGFYQVGANDTNYFAGKLGLNTSTPAAQLEVNGTAQVDGQLTVSSQGILFPGNTTAQTSPWTGTVCGGDYAESVNVAGDRTKFGPGDVLVIDTDNPGKFLKSAEPYSTLVTGVYSTKPGVVGRRQTTPQNADEVPMAMIGIVPAKVSAENGPIRAGDLLVTSSTIGYAMKGTDRNRMMGAIIGKALGNLEDGTGTIEVAVMLQ